MPQPLPSKQKIYDARLVIADWMRLPHGIRKRGMPKAVREAYRIQGVWLSHEMPPEVKRNGGLRAAKSAVNLARKAQASTERSAKTRLATFPREILPTNAKLLVRFNRNTKGRTWTQVVLEHDGYRYRVSAAVAQRRTAAPLGPWEDIPKRVLGPLPSFLRRFLHHMGASPAARR